MNVKQKQMKIGTKAVFSYKKAKNKVRKRQGLSLNSALGLTIAFNNNDIVKRVVLSFICAVMIGLVLVSTSMLFSSYEYTLHKILRNSEDKLLSLFVDGNKENVGDEVAQFVSNECDIKLFRTYDKGGIMHCVDLKRMDENPVPACYEFADGIGQVEIFLDKPEDLGIKMLYGKAPKARNEIAISKTNLDYFLYCKDFQSKTTDKIYHFESVSDIINKQNLIGSNFTIVGVFDDRNKCNNVNSTREEVGRYERNNFLHNAVIRHECLAEESKFFENNIYKSSNYRFSVELTSDDSSDYVKFMPINEAVSDYYNDNTLDKYRLKQDEIVIADSNLIDKMNNMGAPLKVGDNIKLSYVRICADSPWAIRTEEEFFTKTYKIAGIEKDFPNGCVFINEQEYLNIYKPTSVHSRFLLNGAHLSLKNMREICNKYNAFFMLNNLRNINWADADSISATNKYVALPIFILSVFILIILLCVIVSDIIKSKSREVVILKSLGAKQIDIIKVFSTNIMAILFLQITAGIMCGYGLLAFVNFLFNNVINFEKVDFNIFWIGAENMLLSIAGIVFVALVTIVFATKKLNGKNLRKMFQRQKA